MRRWFYSATLSSRCGVSAIRSCVRFLVLALRLALTLVSSAPPPRHPPPVPLATPLPPGVLSALDTSRPLENRSVF